MNTFNLRNSWTITGPWIAGFTDAEGCFSISIIGDKVNTMQVRCDFTLCQKDESTLLKCKAFFDNQIQKLGTKEPMLQDFKPKKDGSYYLKISRQTILLQVIKPLFQECPLLSEKFQDYQLFFAVLEIYTNPNLEKRVRVLYAAYLMFAMNTKGNQRKRNLNDYERILKPAFKSDHEWDIALSQVLKYKQDVLSIPFVDFNKPGILSDDYIVGLIVGDGSFQSYFAMSKTRPGILQRTFDLTLEVADQNLLLFYFSLTVLLNYVRTRSRK